ncbi:MAG: DNA primase [Burkholderia sp.]|nr:DNA primase [Burkholderia sp.]
MIPHSFLHVLLNQVDLVSLVSRFVQLKKVGINLIGLCPFHNEKSPSFTVSPTKQFYYCFGCGSNGTAISFLIEYKGLTFHEAIQELAQSVGLTVQYESSSPHFEAGERNRQISVSTSALTTLSSVMQVACSYYRKQLRISPDAIRYLKNRGLSGEVAARFWLGYAPKSWQNLKSAFQDYCETTLVESGLIIVNDTIDPQSMIYRYDRFRDRIIFPIRNISGHIIGFGGRVLDDQKPKYLNSPETSLFNKSKELYGIFEGRFSIRDRKSVIVVEGYMDVLALVQFGFSNVVATLGTTCTSLHIKKLLQQTDTIIFSFDGDTAGRRAMRRALDACLPYASDNRTIKFIFLPSEYDPESYLHKFGDDAFSKQIEHAIPLSQFILNEIITDKALNQPEGRARALFDAKPILKALPGNVLRTQIIHMIAERLNISFDEIAILSNINTKLISPTSYIRSYNAHRSVTNLEKHALRNLVMYPRIVMYLDSDEKVALCTQSSSSRLFCEIIDYALSLGIRAEFRLLSDMLRTSVNREAYDEIFKEIFFHDENIRDLLLRNTDDSSFIEKRYNNPEHIAAEEVKVAALKIRYAAYSSRLNELTRQATHTPDELNELMRLNRKRTDMKGQLSL